MKSIRVPGLIDESNRLILDESLDVIKPQKVELDIWFIDDDEEEYYPETKEEILEGIRSGLRDYIEERTSPVERMWDELRIKATGSIDEEGQLILDEPLREIKRQDVDVVIWFFKHEISKEKVAENVDRQDRETQIRESIASVR